MLFPQLGPQYYDERDRTILSRMETFYSNAIQINQAYFNEGDLDARYYAGDQTLWNGVYGNYPANRRTFQFNHIRPIINMISGFQRRNRKSTVVIPVENGDQITADQYTKILMWMAQNENVLETVSQAFEGALVTGMNFLHVWLDFRSDPVSGNVRVDNCPYNCFLVDPYFRKHDLSDCNGIWKRTYLTKREVCSLLPDKQEYIMNLLPGDSGGARDGKFQFLPESFNYGNKNLVTYDEFYYRDFRTAIVIVDAETGETLEWKGKDENQLDKFLEQHPQLTTVKQEVPTVRQAIVVQGKCMYDGPNVLNTDLYPFIPVFAYYDPQLPYFNWRVQGVTRALRDPQFLLNRFIIMCADLIESQPNSGWIYKENALVNPLDVFMTGQGKGLALKDSAQMTDVQKIPAAEVPQSFFGLIDMFNKEHYFISNANEELMGSAVDEKAGILSMLRQGAGLTGLQPLFDRLDQAQKLLGRLLIDVIQNNFTPGKVQKILGNNEQPAPQFYNKAFGVYHCMVEEGANTTTQKQMQFAQLVSLHEAGVPIDPEDLLEASTIQNKTKIIERIQKTQQAQQQAQQAAQQSQMQQAAAQTKYLSSAAEAQEATGLERLSRIQENQMMAVERQAAAVKDKDIALFNLMKAAKEVEGMDIQHLDQILAMAERASAAQKASTEPEVQTNEVRKSSPQGTQGREL